MCDIIFVDEGFYVEKVGIVDLVIVVVEGIKGGYVVIDESLCMGMEINIKDVYDE